MNQFQEDLKQCMQNEPAFCSAACPFHLDIREFITKIKRGSFSAAFRLYQNTVGFPGIVASLCDQPCRQVCPRKDTDAAIHLKSLEQAAMAWTGKRDPNSYNMPQKEKSIVVVGGGISGLACTLRLASRKYKVTVYEKSDRIGGHLWSLAAPDTFLPDIEQQFQHEQYTLHLNTEITDLSGLEADAVYIATGQGGFHFGLQPDPTEPFASQHPGFFLGGGLTGSSTMKAIADGLRAADAVEWYLKTGNMKAPGVREDTKIELNTDLIQPLAPVIPGPDPYTQEEALQEAERCLCCSCDSCVRFCDLMRSTKKYPHRIWEEVRITIHPGTLTGDGTVATRLISTCSHCGLCREVCPKRIDTGAFLLRSHQAMHQKGAMPWVFHDFWLQDMDFSASASAFLCRRPPGMQAIKFLFFPGCQLGAADPDCVQQAYAWLLEREPATGIWLSCCGAPAEWAGNSEKMNQHIQELKKTWEKMDRPMLLFACPSCRNLFQKYLPEIQGRFIYEIIAEQGAVFTPPENLNTVSVFDACAARHETALQDAVRSLCSSNGLQLIPLSMERRYANCCSWGGQIATAAPGYARDMIRRRVSESSHPYVVYCINCRDAFLSEEKPAHHILHLVLQYTPPTDQPIVTERRKNRVTLKQRLLKKLWKEEMPMSASHSHIQVSIPDALKQKLSQQRILETDLTAVIAHCEQTGKKVIHQESGCVSGHLKIGHMTYWVKYQPLEDGFLLHSAYAHRMSLAVEKEERP